MILYITRKYPPSVGGMQQVNFELSSRLEKLTDVTLLAWGGSQSALPVILPYFFFAASFRLLFKRRIRAIFLGDALLCPLGWLLKVIFHKPVFVMTHGLDITYQRYGYQNYMPFFFRKMDKMICVSENTSFECQKRGVAVKSLAVIPNGIYCEHYNDLPHRHEARKAISEHFKRDIEGRQILLSVGRLVKRKGFDQFILKTLPILLKDNKDIVYIIVGEGVARAEIEDAVKTLEDPSTVILAGRLQESVLLATYGAADIFVMPNIPVKGDVEGFGIVALEAGSAGLPVVASKIDGIPQAIVEGKNGFLIEYHDHQAFADKIRELFDGLIDIQSLSRDTKEFVRAHFSWERIARDYLELIKVYAEPNDSQKEKSSGFHK